MSDRVVTEDFVPDDVIPRGTLPPMRYRDLPEPQPIHKLIGPGIILVGLALGSGEYIIWPYITYRSGFVFFWACLLGVTTQYFLNMEITRWTLATGESAITGFCRLARTWAWIFLALNIIPWMLPAWASGAAELLRWLIWGFADSKTDPAAAQTVKIFAIAGLWICGAVLTMGPVVYETLERIQLCLVSLVMILVVVLASLVVRSDAIVALVQGTLSFDFPDGNDDLSIVALLGAIAFAGVGGTLNLGQSNYVKDKGFGMGKYIGRITSPITGREEPTSEVGYHFPGTPENMQRWRGWWRAAWVEHFFSFYCTCIVCLVLLTLINYSVFYTPDGELREGMAGYTNNLEFIWREAVEIGKLTPLGNTATVLFLTAGVAILLTTEIGVLDSISRISTDIVKVNWLLDSARWTESRLYYVFLWGVILVGTMILATGVEAMLLVKSSAAMNGGVMFLYSITLLYMNLRSLPQPLRPSWWRSLILVWSILFFGYFTIWAGWAVTKDLLLGK